MKKMKRILAVLLSVSILAGMLVLPASAAGERAGTTHVVGLATDGATANKTTPKTTGSNGDYTVELTAEGVAVTSSARSNGEAYWIGVGIEQPSADYKYVYWYKGADAKGEKFKEGASKDGKDDYVLNNGNLTDEEYKAEDTKIHLDSMQNGKAGFAFWLNGTEDGGEADRTVIWSKSAIEEVDADGEDQIIEVYHVTWEKVSFNIAVDFVAGDGEFSEKAESLNSITLGQEITLPTAKEGSAIKGWYCDVADCEECDGKADSEQLHETYTVPDTLPAATTKITLTAVWEDNGDDNGDDNNEPGDGDGAFEVTFTRTGSVVTAPVKIETTNGQASNTLAAQLGVNYKYAVTTPDGYDFTGWTWEPGKSVPTNGIKLNTSSGYTGSDAKGMNETITEPITNGDGEIYLVMGSSSQSTSFASVYRDVYDLGKEYSGTLTANFKESAGDGTETASIDINITKANHVAFFKGDHTGQVNVDGDRLGTVGETINPLGSPVYSDKIDVSKPTENEYIKVAGDGTITVTYSAQVHTAKTETGGDIALMRQFDYSHEVWPGEPKDGEAEAGERAELPGGMTFKREDDGTPGVGVLTIPGDYAKSITGDVVITIKATALGSGITKYTLSGSDKEVTLADNQDEDTGDYFGVIVVTLTKGGSDDTEDNTPAEVVITRADSANTFKGEKGTYTDTVDVTNATEDGVTVDYNAKVVNKDRVEVSGTVSWSVDEASKEAGVTINSTGELTVPNSVENEAKIEVRAMVNDVKGVEATITVTVKNETFVAYLDAEDGVELEEEDGVYTVTVPGGEEGKTLTITPVAYLGGVVTTDVTWSVEGESNTDVKVEDGVIKVSVRAADNKTYTITATENAAAAEEDAEPQTASVTLKVVRAAPEAKTVTITDGAAEIEIPGTKEAAKTSAKFTATVTDQFGDEFDGKVTWTIQKDGQDVDGVSISSDGAVSVTSDAAKTIKNTEGMEFTVTATCGDASGDATIKVKRAAAKATSLKLLENGKDAQDKEIDLGLDEYKDNGFETTYTATAVDQYGDPVVATISLDATGYSNTGGKVKVEDGKLTIASDAEPGTVKVKATAGDKTAEVTITIKKTVKVTDRTATALTDAADQASAVDGGIRKDGDVYEVTLKPGKAGYKPTQKGGNGAWDYYLGVAISAPDPKYTGYYAQREGAAKAWSAIDTAQDAEGAYIWVSVTTLGGNSATWTLTWQTAEGVDTDATEEKWTIYWNAEDANFARATIKFDAGEAGDFKTAVDDIEALYKEKVTLPVTPEAEGYTFTGWKLDGEGEVVTEYTVTEAAFAEDADDITFVAQWTENEPEPPECECDDDCTCENGCEGDECNCGCGDCGESEDPGCDCGGECNCTENGCDCPEGDCNCGECGKTDSEEHDCSCEDCQGEGACQCDGTNCVGGEKCECEGCKPTPGCGCGDDNCTCTENGCEGDECDCGCGDCGEDEDDNQGSGNQGGGSIGGGGSAPSANVGDAKTDEKSETTTVDVGVSSTTSGTTANATVNSSAMDSAVNKAVEEAAKQETAPVVEINVTTTGQATDLNLNLPTASLKTLAKAEDASLKIVSDIAEVQLDNAALNALVDKATGSTVTLEVTAVETRELSTAQQKYLNDALADVAEANRANEVQVVDISLISNGVNLQHTGGELTITLPYSLPVGRSASDIRVYYYADNGKTERHSGAVWMDGKVTFTTSHLSQYVVSTVLLLPEFTDVVDDTYYTDAVEWAISNRITTGYSNTVFGPDVTCTRAQFVTFLWRLAGEPEVPAGAVNPFNDVAEDAYYYNAVLWAANKGITEGISDTVFAPDDICTRAQVVTFLWRYYDKPKGVETTFTDIDPNEYYIEAVAWAFGEKITDGITSEIFAPGGDCIRAQVVTFLYRANRARQA